MTQHKIVYTPLVSVLMPAYQEDLCLFQKALESILLQTHKKLEVILILDDPKNTALIELARKIQSEDNRIILHINPQNMGLARTLNKAISLASGEYCCRMDSDDLSQPHRIEHQLSYLRSNNLDLVGSYLQVINEDEKKLYQVSTLPLTPSSVKNGLRWNNCIPHPSWLGKRAVFEQQYRLVDLCEDYDFLLRSQLAGFNLGNINEPLVSYRMTPNSISRNNLYDQYLSQCYLARQYRQSQTANLEKLQEWLAGRKSENKALAYAKANTCFNDALKYLSAGKIGVALIHGVKILRSPAYLNKIRRMILASLHSR